MPYLVSYFTTLVSGLDSDQYRQLRNLSVSQEASYIAANLPPTPVEACQIPPCSHHVSCHDPPRPPPRRDVPEPCRCSPEKLRELLAEAVKAGKSMNMKSTGCGGGPPKPIQVTIAPPPPPPPPLPPPPPPPPSTPYKPNQPISKYILYNFSIEIPLFIRVADDKLPKYKTSTTNCGV